MKRKLRVIICVIITLLISLCFSYNITKINYPDLNIMIDSRKVSNGIMKGSIYKDNGTEFQLKHISERKFRGAFVYEKKKVNISVSVKANKISKVIINNRIIRNKLIVNLSNGSLSKDFYNGFYIIKYEKEYNHKTLFFLINFILFAGIIYEMLNAFIKNKYAFIYSGYILKCFKKRDILMCLGICIVGALFVVGVDAKGIYDTYALYLRHDIDIYQLQINIRHFYNFEFTSFAYNPPMLLVVSPILKIWDSLFNSIGFINGYPYIQIFIIKAINFVLIAATTISILSFVFQKDENVDASRLRKIFYLSIFNPLTFYVSFFFVQIDTIPLYLITLGCLHLKNYKNNIFMPVTLISIGIFCKMQLFIIIPSVICLFCIILICDKKINLTDKVKYLAMFLIIFAWIGISTFAFAYKSISPLGILLRNFSQTGRIWFTSIQYAPNLFFYITFAVIIISYVVYLNSFHLKMDSYQAITSTLLFNSALFLIFSFSIINTPSTLLEATAGLVIIFCIEGKLRVLELFFVSILTVFNCLFTNVGDISRILYGWNKNTLVQEMYNGLSAQSRVKFDSLVHTISNSAMLVIGLMMLWYSIKINKKNSCDVLKRFEV